MEGDNAETPRVSIRQGTFRGRTTQDSSWPQSLDVFLGIPYALSASGFRRFGLPVPVPESQETFDARKWGSRCPAKGDDDDPEVVAGEDCLNLNIFRPTGKAGLGKKKLPVLVYIHGGAFNYGMAKKTNIANLVAWAPEPMIGITFNYRLGALGFLPSEVTAAKGVLNLGLKDQRLLLEWVQSNIEAFGGDKDSVTVMGCSAGAHSIGHHIMHTDRPPLFHGAILESGAPTARSCFPYDHPRHQTQYDDFLQELGCSEVRKDQLMSHLRSLPVNKIVAASSRVYDKYNPSLRWAFQPVIEGPGGYISKPPIQKWLSGDYHRMPILTGFNTNEGSMFVPKDMSSSREFRSFYQTLLPNFSPPDLDELEKLYPDPGLHSHSPYKETRAGLGAQFRRIEASYAHWAYIAPVRHTVHLASQQGLEKKDSSSPAYLYHFDVRTTRNGGANHTDQGPFVTFESSVTRKSQFQKKVAGFMHAYWTSFILTGDPNAVPGGWPERPQWPAYHPIGGEKMVFGEGNDEWLGGTNLGISAQVTPDTWAQRECNFWWSKTMPPVAPRAAKL